MEGWKGEVILQSPFSSGCVLSRPYLPNYKSYHTETSDTDRTHYEEVQCTRTFTLPVPLFLGVFALC